MSDSSQAPAPRWENDDADNGSGFPAPTTVQTSAPPAPAPQPTPAPMPQPVPQPQQPAPQQQPAPAQANGQGAYGDWGPSDPSHGQPAPQQKQPYAPVPAVPGWPQQQPPDTDPGQGVPGHDLPSNAVTQPPRPSAERLLNRIDEARTEVERPQSGWRSFIYNLTGGRWNPGLSPEEKHEIHLRKIIRTPLNGDLKVVMIWAQKGGIGKTSLTANVGIALATNRPDDILVLDVNPDGGSLAIRLPKTSRHTVLDLRDALQAYQAGRLASFTPNDLDKFANTAEHRLRAIVMPPGSKPKNPLTRDDFLMLIDALRTISRYKVVLVDCGTDLSSPVMDGVLEEADMMVVPTSTIKDEAVVTIGGLEALVAEKCDDLVRNAIAVVIDKQPTDSRPGMQAGINRTTGEIRSLFGAVTGNMVEVPYDPSIRVGGIIDPDALSPASTKAYLEVGATLVASLSRAEMTSS